MSVPDRPSTAAAECGRACLSPGLLAILYVEPIATHFKLPMATLRAALDDFSASLGCAESIPGITRRCHFLRALLAYSFVFHDPLSTERASELPPENSPPAMKPSQCLLGTAENIGGQETACRKPSWGQSKR
jgi:hypothetical protein